MAFDDARGLREVGDDQALTGGVRGAEREGKTVCWAETDGWGQADSEREGKIKDGARGLLLGWLARAGLLGWPKWLVRLSFSYFFETNFSLFQKQNKHKF